MLVFETEIATPPPPPPLNKQQKKLDLPIEIKLEICGIIKSWQSKSKPILNSSDFERAPEKQNSNAVLTKVSLLNRSWHLAASRYVWVSERSKERVLRKEGRKAIGLGTFMAKALY